MLRARTPLTSAGRVRPLADNEEPRSKLRGITELNSEDFSEAEANPVASYGESQVEKDRQRRSLRADTHRQAASLAGLFEHPAGSLLLASETVQLASSTREKWFINSLLGNTSPRVTFFRGISALVERETGRNV